MAQEAAVEIKIGALAEQSGVHVETIRYYQSLGLLPKPFELEELIEVAGSVTQAALSAG